MITIQSTYRAEDAGYIRTRPCPDCDQALAIQVRMSPRLGFGRCSALFGFRARCVTGGGQRSSG